MSKHIDLKIWQLAMDIVEEVYKLTKQYSTDEKFNLIQHTRKTAISIPSNIAEGRGRKSDKDFIRFLNIAVGSCYELSTQLELAFRLQYLTANKHRTIKGDLDLLLKQTQSLQKKLKATDH